MDKTLPPIHLVFGPTASGKSAYALALAEKNGGVIINADSQQLFGPLRILTARPSVEDEARVPHKLYGILAMEGVPSVASWLKLALMEIDWARAQGQPAIVTGGTGLYLKALMEGLAEIPEVPLSIRAQAEGDLHSMGHAAFHARLSAVDPVAGQKLKTGDSQRLIRAYSVWLASGKPLSYWQAQEQQRPYSADAFTLHPVMPEREVVYRNCDQRFATMLEQGALEEVRPLLSLPEDTPIRKVIGVRELSDYIAGKISLDQAIATATQATRNYAKRQMTWFRNQSPFRG